MFFKGEGFYCSLCFDQVYIAAFAISGYATAYYRNRYKPFNPILGETFECIREDRGFRCISEQVRTRPEQGGLTKSLSSQTQLSSLML